MSTPKGKIAELESWRLAEELIRRGARPPIVQACTDLATGALRRLYTEIHGKGPPNGPFPFNSYRLLAKYRDVVHGNLFLLLYLGKGGTAIFDQICLPALLDAHDEYCRHVEHMGQQDILSFSSAWFIARDLRTGLLETRTCPSCRTKHLYCTQVASLINCPFCRLHLRESWTERILQTKIKRGEGPPRPKTPANILLN
jgi:hypothetical protein